MSRERAVAVGLVLAAAGSLQVGAAFAVTLFDELGPGGAAFLRLALAAIVLWAIWRPTIPSRPPELRLAIAFGVALGLMNWSIYESIARIPLGVAVTIEFAGPLLVAVLGSRRPLDGVWVTLAAAGIVLLADPGGGSIDGLGVLFALCAAGCWMAYIHLSKRTGQTFPGGSGLALAMAVGALIVLPAGVVQGEGALLAPDLLGAALVVALASSVLPYSLELEALRRLPAAVFGVLMSLEPAVAALAGFVVLAQDLGARELVAIAMVVVASAGATLRSGAAVEPVAHGDMAR
jgi:inner membrane transporter RhtA